MNNKISTVESWNIVEGSPSVDMLQNLMPENKRK